VQRKAGVGAIAAATVIAAAIWLAVLYFGPALPGMESLSDRMLFALKCVVVATLFCLVAGVEAVAHEGLQSAAFDPLQRHETRRLRVNLRYLQNTIEQLIIFAVGLFGLAAYANHEWDMRAVLATTIVWILGRWAFWVGYHRSAALRGLGAPGMMANMLMLLYVVWRIGDELAGHAGGAALIGAFLALEALLFWATRERGDA
jgi:hypothetical protein